MTVLINILEISLEVAPWLLGGLVIAGLIKAWIPEARLAGWLGGTGLGPIARGAVFGAPLPLCSCGAIPAGVTLHRGGASRGATTAFMVGTPGIGIDSVALTYALMGPFMAIVRPLGAVASAIATGLLVAGIPERFVRNDMKDRRSCDHRYAPPGPEIAIANRPRGFDQADLPPQAAGSPPCCSETGNVTETAIPDAPAKNLSALSRTVAGVRYTFTDVLNDIGPWMLLGLGLAGVLVTWIPPETLADYGGGWTAMLVMAVIGIPLYLCAQAATPIAAAMIVAGVSPGTAFVFLLAAPMTSLATLAVLRREFGLAPVFVFVVAIAATALPAGLIVDAATVYFSVNVAAQAGEAAEVFGKPIEYLALFALVMLAVPPVQHRLFGNG